MIKYFYPEFEYGLKPFMLKLTFISRDKDKRDQTPFFAE